MALPLAGTEEISLELEGTLDDARARSLLGEGLEPELISGGARCALLVFAMKDLKMQRMPGPAFSYREALWRVGARWAGGEGWLAVACDLDEWTMRPLASAMIRYPVRSADLTVGDTRVEVHAESAALALTLSAPTAAEGVAPRRTLVRSRGRLFEVPWDEVPAQKVARVAVAVEERGLVSATLGDVAWASHGLLLHGRGHRCGFARRLVTSPAAGATPSTGHR